MTSTIQENGTPLSSIFAPYVAGTDKAPNSGIMENGTDTSNLYAKLSYGSAAAATGISAPNGDLNTYYAAINTTSYSLPINGQTYHANVNVPAAGSGNTALRFILNTATTYQVNVLGAGGALTPANGTVLASGSLPSGAATIQYTLTYLAEPGDTGPATASNTAFTPTAIASGLYGMVTISGTGTGSPKQSTYQLQILIRNSGGSVISTTTVTFAMSQEGSA